MTTKILFASNKLGVITNEQLQQMLNQHNLGKLISSKKTDNGAMGQTMFVHSSKGEFVLKGNPLFPGQFEEEHFFVNNISGISDVPVPTPYFIGATNSYFSWSYAIMPRLKGKHLNDIEVADKLMSEDKIQIAESMANTLLQLHSWKVDVCGEFNPNTKNLSEFKEGFTIWLFNRIRYWVEDAKKYSKITLGDVNWVENVLQESLDAFDQFDTPTFVMGDFKPGNFLILYEGHEWKISGVFDFTNAYFGDPLADLIKMLTMYIDHNELDVAKHFFKIYMTRTDEKEQIIQRLKVHMLMQRTLDWGCAKAIGAVTWDEDMSFSVWVEHYLKTMEELIREIEQWEFI
ncbi:aminoglycoside phosphotransferase family protein [Viridibacillus sp. FSL R5-0477]|uniref:Phosphotransferase domain-containing protein n=1 Tax=Viridibacillus arenosi FSL R5-213 TaxID=1227360 RepID=W4F1W8_9BACL|nr:MULTISPECIES: aminoglycoside phosphotransferase family protein [Viridibacillus]ETT86853.1 phosphotransferase domain-containing protein [Viridibacillus arenosi FSL R5-213]OMC83195.1 phosphotransferase [Viridibacillus sp. FSL H7-0596]OMC88208.1 phosphotransferase [Viridibacillus arenosi]